MTHYDEVAKEWRRSHVKGWPTCNKGWAGEFQKFRKPGREGYMKTNLTKTAKFWLCVDVGGAPLYGSNVCATYEAAAKQAKRLADESRRIVIVVEAVKKFVPSMTVAEIGFDEEIETDYSFEVQEPE